MSSHRSEEEGLTHVIKDINTNEISYAILTNGSSKNSKDLLEKFATTINVQLILQPGQQFPFIPFNGFDKVKEASKSFLYGPSGCGKSRCIYELVKERIVNNFKNILIINPRHTMGAKESGRANLKELLTKVSHDDAIIWDNFPDDLINTDLDSAASILEELSSQQIKALFVSLKPRYLEIYRDIPNKIFDLSVHEINYDKENFKSIIEFYGFNLKQFNEIYEMVHSKRHRQNIKYSMV